MSLVLNIDTSVESGSVSLSRKGSLLKFRANENQREHASWLHLAIREMMEEAKLQMQELNAVAVSNGPGSYTGLRIGLATAKGLCFALQIPLICIPTTMVMAAAANNQASAKLLKSTELLCPLIDARRMEVYFALYDLKLNEVSPPRTTILDKDAFISVLSEYKVLFFGNGAEKLKSLVQHTNAVIADHIDFSAIDMCLLSYEYYIEKRFNDMHTAEPLYIKDFYFPKGK